MGKGKYCVELMTSKENENYGWCWELWIGNYITLPIQRLNIPGKMTTEALFWMIFIAHDLFQIKN